MKVIIELEPKDGKELDERRILRSIEADTIELCFYYTDIKTWKVMKVSGSDET